MVWKNIGDASMHQKLCSVTSFMDIAHMYNTDICCVGPQALPALPHLRLMSSAINLTCAQSSLQLDESITERIPRI